MWRVRVELPWACFGLEVTEGGWIARLPAPRPMLTSSLPTAGRLPGRQSGYVDPTQQRKSQEAEAMGELMGIARFKIHEGKLEEYKRLSAQAMEIVRTKESGTLQYDTYFNDDQSECVVIERYRDSEAATEHAANLADVSAAVLAAVDVVHGELLGEPSAELRAKLAGSEVPQLFTPYESM
jgi:quinol monooxygenase YgiN